MSASAHLAARRLAELDVLGSQAAPFWPRLPVQAVDRCHGPDVRGTRKTKGDTRPLCVIVNYVCPVFDGGPCCGKAARERREPLDVQSLYGNDAVAILLVGLGRSSFAHTVVAGYLVTKVCHTASKLAYHHFYAALARTRSLLAYHGDAHATRHLPQRTSSSACRISTAGPGAGCDSLYSQDPAQPFR